MKLEYLFQNISAINKKYENIANFTGEKFNIFRILKMESDEVRTHSAFLAELLSPKGSHGQNEKFLKLFCEEFKIKFFNWEEVTVTANKYIGPISKDYSKGGFLDIIVIDKNNRAIIFEIKINAGDQENQLVRYFKYGEEECNSFDLLYLTLDGKDATERSKSDLTETKFRRISYKSDLLNWLEKCKEKAVDHSMLRETITQYIYLIKHLTHQTMFEENKKEIIDAILKTSENIEAAENIADSWTAAKFKIIDNLKVNIEKDTFIRNKLKLFVEFDKDFELGMKESSFWFFKKEWTYCFCFCFETEFEDLLFGIFNRKINSEVEIPLKETVTKRLSNADLGRNKNYSGWLWVADFKTWKETPWKNIEATIPLKINEILQKSIKYLEGIQL